MSYDSDVDVILPPPVSDTILIDRTRAAAFDLIAAPPCILDADFLLDVVELGDRLQSLAADRDAALRSTAELTRERDRWFMAALGACADSGIPTPANAREEFTPESMASEIRRLASSSTKGET